MPAMGDQFPSIANENFPDDILEFGNLSIGRKHEIKTTKRKKNASGKKINNSVLTKCLALDCEMVGVGSNGAEHMLARVSIVNERGEVVIDKYVRPSEKVTDYRTGISGILPHLIENAEKFDKIQQEVQFCLHGRILVGHAVKNDLKVLYLTHPKHEIRDTSMFGPIARRVGAMGTPSLKNLSKYLLDMEIQNGTHDSVEDARAAMSIYLMFKEQWEKHIKNITKYRHFY